MSAARRALAVPSQPAKGMALNCTIGQVESNVIDHELVGGEPNMAWDYTQHNDRFIEPSIRNPSRVSLQESAYPGS